MGMMVLDESHCFVYDYTFRNKTLKRAKSICWDQCTKLVLLSATVSVAGFSPVLDKLGFNVKLKKRIMDITMVFTNIIWLTNFH